MQKHSKWKAVLLLLVVFACGAGGGVLGAKYYLGRQFRHTIQGDRRSFEDHIVDRLSRELGLTQQQRQDIRPIIAATTARMHELKKELQPRLDALVDESVVDIKKHLDPSQDAKIDRIVERMREHRKQFEDFPPPPPIFGPMPHEFDKGAPLPPPPPGLDFDAPPPPPPGQGPDGPPPPRRP